MQVMVETNDGLERKMRVTVPSDQVELRISEKIRQTAKTSGSLLMALNDSKKRSPNNRPKINSQIISKKH